MQKNGFVSDASMDEKKEKSIKIVKSLKLLEGVLKTSPDSAQRTRVKKEIDDLRDMLQKMYPEANLADLEDAIYSDTMVRVHSGEKQFSRYETLRDIQIETISHAKGDEEINIAAGIMKYFEERIWGVIADQHTKLDFSNSGIRDGLYRNLDQCGRSLKMFMQTISDIERSRSTEYVSQLQMMKIKQGRLFLIDLSDFLKKSREFVSNLVSDAEFGGSMVLNPAEVVTYAEYEKYKVFQNWTILDALKYLKKFIVEFLGVLNVPDLKKS